MNLSSITYETTKSQREEKRKGMVLGQIFHFQIFECSENLEKDFSMTLSKCL